jgi:ABC-type transport system involved in multi-copper enzyme maturation permease subunit
MIVQLKAELLKVRSTRTTIGLVLGMIGLVVLIVVLSGLLSHADGLTSTKDQLGLISSGGVAVIFSALAGVLLITSEYRYGTIHPTFVFTPRRGRVLSAKLAAGLLAGLVFGVVGVGLALGIGSLILSARGIPSALSTGQITLLVFGGLAGIALRGAFGVGLGAILRNQVAAVIGLLAWDFVVTSLLFGLVPSVGRLMPTTAVNALMGLKTAHLLSPAAGAAVLVGWTVVLALAGLVLIQRRDVT